MAFAHWQSLLIEGESVRPLPGPRLAKQVVTGPAVGRPVYA
jgi:hypothetical protein